MTATPRSGDETADLLDRLSAGDQQAFALLFDEHVDMVHRFAVRRLRSQTDAEDVTSVVFLTAWRRRADLRTLRCSLPAWLVVTADQTANNLLRARRREAALIDRLSRSRDPGLAVDGVDSADGLLPEAVLAALGTLRRADRQVLTLALVSSSRTRRSRTRSGSRWARCGPGCPGPGRACGRPCPRPPPEQSPQRGASDDDAAR